MAFNDYFMRQVEQLAKVLAAMLGMQEKGQHMPALELLEAAFEEELDWKPEDWLPLPKNLWMEEFGKKLPYRPDAWNAVADLLFAAGESYNNQQQEEKARSCYEKALAILDYLNQEEKTYDFNRQERIKQLKNRLS